MKPFVQWVGGKAQLLQDIKSRFPETINNYYEPFVGGGAVMFSLNQELSSITINDLNSELILAYEMVRDSPNELMDELDSFGKTHEDYLRIRSMDRDPEFLSLSKITRGARMIYLTKTGFNGLFRTNSKGQNNVAYGHKPNIALYCRENILECSNHLQGVKISNDQFDFFVKNIKENDFVYLDPPYQPMSVTSNFKGYINDPFSKMLLERTLALCEAIDKAGARFMMSNSDAPSVKEAFARFNIEVVTANRTLNTDSTKRGKVNEVLVFNYPNPSPIDFQ